MKFKKIILLTATYPYDTGESFIENEIEVITKYCDKLIVIPMKNSKKSSHRLNGINGVEIIKLNSGLLDYIFAAVKVLISRNVRREIDRIKKQGKLNVYTLLSIVCFYCKGETKIKKLSEILENDLKGENNLIYSYWSGTPAYVAAGIKRRYPKCCCVTRAHGYDIYQENLAPYYIPFKDDTFATMQAIFSASIRGCEYLQRKFPNIKEKIFKSYLGTMDYGINPDRREGIFRIVSCSNVIAIKRIDRIINSLSLMKHEITWEHYGDGPLMDDMIALAAKLPKNIKYEFKGRCSNKELMKIYARKHIDLFINVSESEGLPVSIMEACSFGIPIIATDVGGNREIVQDGGNGYLLPETCSVADIAKLINRFISLPMQDVLLMRSNARKIWENNFMAKKNYEDFFQLLLKEMRN